jgi:hypothetical protein
MMTGHDGAKPGGVALSVHNLSKRFGDRVAFQGVSFEVLDITGRRIVSPVFDRERLITGTR